MKAIEAFRASIERADGLLSIHRLTYPRGRPPKVTEAEDLLRAVVVFSVSALDSYLHDKILENVVQVVQHGAKAAGQGIPGSVLKILEEDLPLNKALALLYRKRPDEEIRRSLSRKLGERT